MAVQGYIAVVLLFPFLFGSTMAAFEEMITVPQPAYESPVSGELSRETKRFPDHFNNAPPSWFWFNLGECPETEDGVKQFFCASLSSNGKSVCIDDHQLCNGVKECPSAEDEHPKYCLFYKALKANLQGLERDVQNLVHSYMRAPARRYNTHGITHQQDYHRR